jgi:hypothetical protein
MTKYKHSLKNQSISFKDAIIELEPITPRFRLNYDHIAVFSVGILCTLLALMVVRSCHNVPIPLRDCTACHNKFTSYFQGKGSKNPEVMANAILKTRSPRLMASIASVESGGNPTIRRAGYKNRHDGAFQVNPRYHGAVSHNAVEQALQAERILEELTGEKNNIRLALNAYGGDTKGHYANKVLAELTKVP